MTSNTDFILIGGGIIGLLTARELFNAGMSVTVIEQGEIGRESSWAGGGIILPLYPWRQQPAITDLVKPGFTLYPALAAELIASTGIDPEYSPCGLLMTQNPDLENALDWCKRHAVPYEMADSSWFVNLDTHPVDPLWLPSIAQIRNPRLLKSVKQDLRQKGVRLLENCRLTAVNVNKNRIQALDTSAGEFKVNELLLTAGAWTAKLMADFFPSLKTPVPVIAPVRGQMLLFKAKPDTLTNMVLDGSHYLIPRLDGHILAGSTVEADIAFDKSPTSKGKSELFDFAVRLLPALKQFPLVNHWAGLRPGTEEGIPYIGRHPHIANLSVNAGHFRNGLAMAPASAKLMADLLLGRPTVLDPEPYRLNR